jgi:hypothetical protein
MDQAYRNSDSSPEVEAVPERERHFFQHVIKDLAVYCTAAKAVAFCYLRHERSSRPCHRLTVAKKPQNVSVIEYCFDIGTPQRNISDLTAGTPDE